MSNDKDKQTWIQVLTGDVIQIDKIVSLTKRWQFKDNQWQVYTCIMECNTVDGKSHLIGELACATASEDEYRSVQSGRMDEWDWRRKVRADNSDSVSSKFKRVIKDIVWNGVYEINRGSTDE